MRLKASDTGGIWPYEKRLTPRCFILPQRRPDGVLKRLLTIEPMNRQLPKSGEVVELPNFKNPSRMYGAVVLRPQPQR